MEDPGFRQRQLIHEGPVSAGHFLHTYLAYIKCSRTIERNTAMVDNLKEMANAKDSDAKNKKPIKPQDLVRLYETIIQVS